MTCAYLFLRVCYFCKRHPYFTHPWRFPRKRRNAFNESMRHQAVPSKFALSDSSPSFQISILSHLFLRSIVICKLQHATLNGSECNYKCSHIVSKYCISTYDIRACLVSTLCQCYQLSYLDYLSKVPK